MQRNGNIFFILISNVFLQRHNGVYELVLLFMTFQGKQGFLGQSFHQQADIKQLFSTVSDIYCNLSTFLFNLAKQEHNLFPKLNVWLESAFGSMYKAEFILIHF